MRSVIIANPVAGTCADQATLGQAAEQIAAELWKTSGPKDASVLAKRAVEEGFERVIAAGGDGTIHEVVNGLSTGFDHIVFGILPMGTGNDLVRCLRIPNELPAALELLRHQPPQELDIIEIEGSAGREGDSSAPIYSLNASVSGYGPSVGENLDSATKSTWGPLAYLKSALETIGAIEGFECRVSFDGSESLELRLLNVVVANGSHVAAGLPVSPWADPADGIMDVVLFPELPILELALLAPRVLIGEHLDDPRLIIRHCRHFRIESEPPMPYNADGERGGTTPVTYRLLPKALRVICGFASDSATADPGTNAVAPPFFFPTL